jgi:hypothetical protein
MTKRNAKTHVADEMAAKKSTIPCCSSRMGADLEVYAEVVVELIFQCAFKIK